MALIWRWSKSILIASISAWPDPLNGSLQKSCQVFLNNAMFEERLHAMLIKVGNGPHAHRRRIHSPAASPDRGHSAQRISRRRTARGDHRAGPGTGAAARVAASVVRPKSEARGTDQKDLFLNEAEALASTAQTLPAEIDDEESTAVAGHQRKKRGRKPLDPALPRDIVRHELPESERICAHDGHALVEIGAEVSEQMHVIPEQVRVLQHHRIKYACPCCDLSLKIAPTPARIIPRGLLTEEAQAWVITGKYQFGMPLYRTAVLLRRFGGDIVSNTLAAGVVRIGQAVQPIINLLRDHLLDSDLIYGDETTVQVLKEPGRQAQSKSFMWAQMNGSGPPVRLFAYAPGRGAVHAHKLYAGIRRGATLVSDGYQVYDGIAAEHGLTHLGCWVHYLERCFILREAALRQRACDGAEVRTPHKIRSLTRTARTRACRPWASMASCSPARCRPFSRTPAWRHASSADWL